jgi:plasmid stability protein
VHFFGGFMTNLTISLDETVIRKARIRAIQEGTSVSAKVREFLSRYAGSNDAGISTTAITLPVFDGHSGMQSGVAPTSNQSLLRAIAE